MGINISLYKVGPQRIKDHPDWDFLRHAGDREFAELASGLPHVVHRESWDDEGMVRPADFPAWRSAIEEWEKTAPNVGRFTKMLAILEAEPDCWIFFGY
jgi:hypothetical protein